MRYIYSIQFLLNDIKKYIEQTHFTFGSAKILLEEGKTRRTTLFLQKIYLSIKDLHLDEQSEDILIYIAKNINMSIEQELQKKIISNREILKSWNRKLTRNLPIQHDIENVSNSIANNVASKKDIYDKYICIIRSIEKNIFNEHLLYNFLFICKDLLIESNKNNITNIYIKEIDNLFYILYKKYFSKKILKPKEFIIFCDKMIDSLSDCPKNIREKLDTHSMYFLLSLKSIVPPGFYNEKIDSTNIANDFELNKKYHKIIEKITQIKGMNSQINSNKIINGFKFKNSKHIFKISPLMIKNILSTMNSNIDTTSVDLNRCHYFINQNKYYYQDDNVKKNLEKFISDLKKSNIKNEFSLDFIQKYAHQGALIAGWTVWFIEHLVRKNRVPSQRNIILLIDYINENTIKVTSIFNFKAINIESLGKVNLSYGLALIFQNEFKFISKDHVSVLNTKLGLANMSDEKAEDRVILETLKKAIEVEGIRKLSSKDKKNETHFMINDVQHV